tara:strand:+ start:1038 stop:1937 length:900 start_codon:yes stop_codon:yes gene_type:complete
MTEKKILIVSGTHGNEINPVWAVKKFRNLRNKSPQSKSLEFILGNPKALEEGLRYIDVDLNRSFNVVKTLSNQNFYEINRSEYLINEYGFKGHNSFPIVIDLHTTTSCMGTSIVMYGRRQRDFCLAAILQAKFGLPIYLHEKDKNQTGFLVEAWPCGLVIEIGPVAQNHYDSEITERFMIILDFLGDLIDNLENNRINLPSEISIFVHQNSIDYPRDENIEINALIHPLRINNDWKRIEEGDPLFLNFNNETLPYKGEEKIYPLFIGEAAYREKNIAMSFTKKEILKCDEAWINSLLTF